MLVALNKNLMSRRGMRTSVKYFALEDQKEDKKQTNICALCSECLGHFNSS